LLWDYYAVKEEEGLERFENSLSKHSDFEKRVQINQDLKDLSSLIDETNRKL
jgi:glutaredoxin 2